MIIIEAKEKIGGIRMGRVIIDGGKFKGIRGGPDDKVQCMFERVVKDVYEYIVRRPIMVWDGDIDNVIGQRIVEEDNALKTGYFRANPLDPDVVY